MSSKYRIPAGWANIYVKISLTGFASVAIAYLLIIIMGNLNKPDFKKSSVVASGNTRIEIQVVKKDTVYIVHCYSYGHDQCWVKVGIFNSSEEANRVASAIDKLSSSPTKPENKE
ncbi:MAG: hypothetical protein WC309_03170 [Candidatus Paceibacterota bacterium]|jgi:hypothetical protein